ncbi:hypothetical protein F1C10_08265 [Sphingomonas sp. NBWT7]|uniref:hypothetical protein n=1 Tax=Sphingomonas sp. NBWT7 TaxID=2596913 RepID=UPI0016284FAD|nr:hypothetical protein [Sphingomonas sp. NBWT7]QNE31929.1 hypothetical protein F1C10_08265 [Sphingomonas sp. NBWT7]
MRVHPPKPLHGWREFFGEVGIIVMGVLIALGAEQVVENFHWQDKANYAREALRSELQDAYFQAAERIEVTPCLITQIEQLQSRVLSSTDRLNKAPVFPSRFGPITFRHPVRPWTDTIWQSVLTEQVTSHLAPAERENLSSAYRSLAQLRAANEKENEQEGAFQMLASAIPLDASLRAHLLETLANERWRAQYMNLVAGQISIRIKKIDGSIGSGKGYSDWRRAMAGPDTTATWCRAQRLPLSMQHSA